MAKEKKNNVLFWTVIAMISTFFPTLLLFWQSRSPYFPFILFLPVGFILCLKKKLKGLALSSLFFLAIAFFLFSSFSFEEKVWASGLLILMIASLYIMVLAVEELEETIQKLEFESESRLKNLIRLDDKLKKIEQGWQEKNKDKTEQKEQEIYFLEKQLKLAKKEIQKQKENDLLEKQLRQKEGMYNQLRKQFIEKSKVLLETRKELFQIKEKELLYEKEKEEEEMDRWQEWEKFYLKELQSFEERDQKQKEEYNEEIAILQDIIHIYFQKTSA